MCFTEYVDKSHYENSVNLSAVLIFKREEWGKALIYELPGKSWRWIEMQLNRSGYVQTENSPN